MKKQKWINTRYSKPYKMRMLMRRIAAAHLIVSGQVNISQIIKAYAPKQAKAAAMACQYISTMKSVSELINKPDGARMSKTITIQRNWQ